MQGNSRKILSTLIKGSTIDRISTLWLLGTVAVGRLSSSKAFFLRRNTFSRHHTTLAAKGDSAFTMSVPHVNNSTLPSWMLAERTRIVTSKNPRNLENENGNCIFYWMQRDVRTVDNWALLYGTHLAQKANVPLRVVYCLPPPPTSYQNDRLAPKMLLEAPMTERYGTFLLGGVEQVHEQLKSADVPFHVVKPSSHDDVGETLMACLDEWQPRAVVCDTSPLKPYRKWMEEQLAPLLETQGVPLIQVDAHNVVPVWHASPKREIGARTLRSKLSKLMPEFLTEYPDIRVGNSHLTDSAKPKTFPGFSKQDYIKFLGWDDSVPPVDWCQPGTENAEHQLEDFLKNGLSKFDQLRNNPNYGREICSNLSPWINHGHISFQTIAKKVKSLNKYANGTASFLEEGIVRRELSDNYVYYTPDNYDELEAALGWAQETLATHASDKREWLFSRDELEEGHSHDDLWNAAQLQLVSEGKLHGFLRMYWAKKILEWTDSPLTALRTAQYFNDKFALDGCDPNGFVGVGWSIMGIHDQGWKEREIFGKIRYMNYAGCKRKFDVANFVAKYPSALENAIAAAKALGKERETGAGKPKKTDSNKKKKTAAGTKRKR